MGNHVRSARVRCSPIRCGPVLALAATAASSQQSCRHISPSLRDLVLRSIPRGGPCLGEGWGRHGAGKGGVAG